MAGRQTNVQASWGRGGSGCHQQVHQHREQTCKFTETSLVVTWPGDWLLLSVLGSRMMQPCVSEQNNTSTFCATRAEMPTNSHGVTVQRTSVSMVTTNKFENSLSPPKFYGLHFPLLPALSIKTLRGYKLCWQLLAVQLGVAELEQLWCCASMTKYSCKYF